MNPPTRRNAFDTAVWNTCGINREKNRARIVHARYTLAIHQAANEKHARDSISSERQRAYCALSRTNRFSIESEIRHNDRHIPCTHKKTQLIHIISITIIMVTHRTLFCTCVFVVYLTHVCRFDADNLQLDDNTFPQAHTQTEPRCASFDRR